MEHRRAVYKGWLLPDSSCSPFSVLIVGKFFHENKEADRVLSVPPATDPDIHPAQKLRRFCSITRSATLFFSLLAAVSFSPSPHRRRPRLPRGKEFFAFVRVRASVSFAMRKTQHPSARPRNAQPIDENRANRGEGTPRGFVFAQCGPNERISVLNAEEFFRVARKRVMHILTML